MIHTINASAIRKFFRRAVVLALLLLAQIINASAQSAFSITDGATPLGLEPGAPAGSYALSGFDNINLFNGNLNFRLPMLPVGGRGASQYQVMLPIENRWRITHQPRPDGQPGYINIPMRFGWAPISPGYSPGVLIGRTGEKTTNCNAPLGCSTTVTLTRLTFLAEDGTEYELRDQQSEGKPNDFSSSVCAAQLPPQYSRGTVFVTADGTAMTFTSDQTIFDSLVGAYVFPSGYLMLRDGTRMRIEDGMVKWMRDRNGNKLDFTYDEFGMLTMATDSLNRTVAFGIVSDPNNGVFYDEITFKGFGGATRTIKVFYTNLAQVLRTGAAQGSTGYTLKKMNQLFPDLNGSDDSFNDPFVLSKVELPDHRFYKFYYNSYADLARVELPTGGAYEYDYPTTSGVVQGQLVSCPSPIFVMEIFRRVSERRVYPDGLTLESRVTYTATQNSDTTVTVTHLNAGGTSLAIEKHYFHNTSIGSLSQQATAYPDFLDGKEVQTESLDPATGNVLRRSIQTFVNRDTVSWWGQVPGYVGGQPPNDPRMTETTITLMDVTPPLVSKQIFDYDKYNNRTDTWEYDFAPNMPPDNPLRHTHTDFLKNNSVNGVNYATNTNVHLRGLPKEQLVYVVNPANGTETLNAQVTFEYDKYDSSSNHAPLVDRPDISGHESSMGTTYQTRGNATSISRWLNTNSSWISIYQQYDIAGNLIKTVDALDKATTYIFTDSFGSPNGEAQTNSSPSELTAAGKKGYAFPASVINPLTHTVFMQYDFYTGKAVDKEDENGIIDSIFYNDILDRLTQVVEAVNTSLKIQTHYSYNDPGRIVGSTTDLNTFGDNQIQKELVYDGLGRTIEMHRYEPGGGFVTTRQTFDGMGRVNRTYNPYRATSDSTYGWSDTTYDALSRVTKIETFDKDGVTTGSAQNAYSGNRVLNIDQASKERISQTNGIGQLTDVWEIRSADGATEAISFPNHSEVMAGYRTKYTFNAQDKVTGVTQGSQNRTFTYDTLARLTQASIPEQVNPTNYVYDKNSNMSSKTDPRGVVTTYAYDVLNRISTVNFDISNAPGVAVTPNVTYTYDAPSVTNSKGKLTSVSSSTSGFSTSYSYDEYDAQGRVKRSSQTTDGQPYLMSYEYNLAGELKKEVYPSQKEVTIGYDSVGRTSSINGTWRATAYASLISYTPSDETHEMKLGNGLWERNVFNSRLQLTEVWLGTAQGTSDKLKLKYDYGSTANNGNILSQTITTPGITPQVQNYSYDSLNRLLSAQETVNAAMRWTQSYGYDRFANRTSLVNTGSEGALLPTQSTPSINASTNRVSGYTYDKAGNLLVDGMSNSFIYDAESQQVSFNGTATYNYDAGGMRVRKVVSGVTTLFIYDTFGKLIAEYTSNTPQPLAGGGASYLTSDHLGSTRVVTNQSGGVKARHDYLPFGEEVPAGVGGRTTGVQYGVNEGLRQKFTSKQRDIESNLDYFGARYYSGSQGRFTAVDPLDASAHLNVPQSWNRYAYVLNNPLAIIDPNGMGWYQIGTYLYWDEKVTDQDSAVKRHGKNAVYLPPGTIRTVTSGSGFWNKLVGHTIILFGNKTTTIIDLGKPREEIKQIQFYGGDGEKFLLAYFKFALENAVAGYVGGKAIDAIKALYQLAKAKRAGQAVYEMLDAAKAGNSIAGSAGGAGSAAASDWPLLSGMLRKAAAGKGNFGIGSATRSQAQAMGEAWVGPGHRVASDGTTLISADGLRAFRAPSFKPHWKGGTWQANFESRVQGQLTGNPMSNAHLDITNP